MYSLCSAPVELSAIKVEKGEGEVGEANFEPQDFDLRSDSIALCKGYALDLPLFISSRGCSWKLSLLRGEVRDKCRVL